MPVQGTDHTQTKGIRIESSPISLELNLPQRQVVGVERLRKPSRIHTEAERCIPVP